MIFLFFRNVKNENDELKTKMRSRNVTPAKNHIVRPLEEWTKTSLIVESSKINSYDETLDIPIIIVIQGIQVLKKAILKLQ